MKLSSSVFKEFKKSRQFFIGARDETLPVAAMRISDPDCSSLRIHGVEQNANKSVKFRLDTYAR
jgi:hypothetical protein